MIKVLVPEHNASKVMKFEWKLTLDDVKQRIEKYVSQLSPTAKVEGQLYLPQQDQDGNITGPRGTWFVDLQQPLSAYKAYLRNKSVIQYKKRTKEPEIPSPEQEKDKKKINSKDEKKINERDSKEETSAETPTVKEKLRGLLGRFFENRATQEELIQRKILKEEVHAETPIPISYDLCVKIIAFIESTFITVEGIYRTSGQASVVRKLCKSFAGEFDLTTHSSHDICSAFKLYFREMNPPLVPFECYDKCLSSSAIENHNEQIKAMREAINSFPPLHKKVFELLCRHLNNITKYSDKNMMVATNLGICIGPSILRPKVEPNINFLIAENEKKVSFTQKCVQCVDEIFAEVIAVPPPAKEYDSFNKIFDSFLSDSVSTQQNASELLALLQSVGYEKFEKFITEECGALKAVNVICRMATVLY